MVDPHLRQGRGIGGQRVVLGDPSTEWLPRRRLRAKLRDEAGLENPAQVGAHEGEGLVVVGALRLPLIRQEDEAVGKGEEDAALFCLVVRGVDAEAGVGASEDPGVSCRAGQGEGCAERGEEGGAFAVRVCSRCMAAAAAGPLRWMRYRV